MKLETKRLILRRPCPEDATAYAAIHNSQFVLRYNAMAPTRAERMAVKFTDPEYADNALFLEEKESGKLIGAIFLEEDDLRYGVASKSLSYFIDEASSRKGYMKEAMQALLGELGFEIEEFGENTVLVRQIPMDLGEGEIADTLMEMADDLSSGRGADRTEVRDGLLHTMACKAAIKAGWKSDEKELLTLVRQVMEREDLKYCPHGRPICVTLSKKQLEKQFKRT